MKSASTQGWFSVQSYFNPTQEEPEQQNSSSYGSLGTTTTAQSSNQDHVVDDWDWDQNSMPADQQKLESSENGAAEKNEVKSEPQDDGWDEHGDWGEADSWSNESWSTSRTKAKELGKKGD